MESFYRKIYLQSWQIIKYNWYLLIFGLFVSLMGFKEIKNHPLFWNDIDYHCTSCGPKKCICTAQEMILYLS